MDTKQMFPVWGLGNYNGHNKSMLLGKQMHKLHKKWDEVTLSLKY